MDKNLHSSHVLLATLAGKITREKVLVITMFEKILPWTETIIVVRKSPQYEATVNKALNIE